jgi:hypothetical protein
MVHEFWNTIIFIGFTMATTPKTMKTTARNAAIALINPGRFMDTDRR